MIVHADRVDDGARLAALAAFGILDTPPEVGFDDIVHLAGHACDAPVALVSLVDRDRQWFKARVGFPACETDLDRSVCRFVLGVDDVLQIPDLAADPRTRDNPLVTGEPHIRFYAGAPLRTAGGETLGSLCVIDHAPRPAGLTGPQADALRRLARQVMQQLELRLALRARDDLLAERRETQHGRDVFGATQADVAGAGGQQESVFDRLLAGAMEAVPTADGAVLELVDGDALEYRATRGSLAAHRGLRVPLEGSSSGRSYRTNSPVLVADASGDARISRDLADAIDLGSSIHVPVTRGDTILGVLKLQSRRAGAFTDRDVGLAQLFAGTATAGLTQVSEADARRAVRTGEARYRAVFESIVDYAIVVMNLDGDVTDWNTGAERTLGWSADEMRGRPADVFFTPEDREAGMAAEEMRQAREHGRGADERWHMRKGGERFFASGEMMVLRDEGGTATGYVKVLRDRTGQRLAEERLRQADERLQMALAASGDVGLWDWMVDTDLLHGDAHFARLYGLDVDRTAAGVTMEQYQEFVVPEDVAPLRAATRATFDGGAPFHVAYRLALPGRPLRWVECKGRLIPDETGAAVRFSGTAVDITARKATEAALRERQRDLDLERGLFEAIFRQAPVGISIAGATPDVPSILNDQAEAILGHGIGAAGDARYRDYGAHHADGRPYEADDYPTLRALRRGETVRAEDLHYRNARTGEMRLLEVSSSPVRDADGIVRAAATVMVDVTDRRRIEQQARRLALVVEQSRDFVGIAGPDGAVAFVNEAGRRLVGLPDLEAAHGTRVIDYFAADERARVRDEVLPTVEREGYWEGEVRFRRFDTGAPVPVLYNIFPVRDRDGALLGYGTVTRDLTETKRTEAALRKLAAVAEQSGDFIGIADAQGRLEYVNPAGRAMLGLADEASARAVRVRDVFFPEDLPHVEAEIMPAVVAGGAWVGDYRFRNFATGEPVPVHYNQFSLRGPDGAFEGLATVSRDITERKRAEERQDLLNRELSHRLKNVFAMVQAIAGQTLRGATDVEAAREVLSARLIALGKAHDILLGGAAESARLAAVVREGVGVASDDRRVRYEGPDIEIGGKAALSLALTLHELTTNALKYGALSVPDGRVAVTAAVGASDRGPLLRIVWQESGGPPVAAPPARKGFGSRLIERSLSAQVGASLRRDWEPGGLRCVVEATLAEFQAMN